MRVLILLVLLFSNRFAVKSVKIPRQQRSVCPEYSEEYDFIVIGVGTAGATVATRLSEASQWRILATEKGQRADSEPAYPGFNYPEEFGVWSKQDPHCKLNTIFPPPMRF